MVLQADDIAAWRVNWEHKSENLRELADELNLGLDSFVFLDDDPAVRMEVKTRAPDVHVVPLPAGSGRRTASCSTASGCSTALRPRRRMRRAREKAQEEQQRRRGAGTAASLDEFLRPPRAARSSSRVAGDDDWPRVAQLTQRTNQFNLSLKRRTLEEVKALGAEHTVLVLRGAGSLRRLRAGRRVRAQARPRTRAAARSTRC